MNKPTLNDWKENKMCSQFTREKDAETDTEDWQFQTVSSDVKRETKAHICTASINNKRCAEKTTLPAVAYAEYVKLYKTSLVNVRFFNNANTKDERL